MNLGLFNIDNSRNIATNVYFNLCKSASYKNAELYITYTTIAWNVKQKVDVR